MTQEEKELLLKDLCARLPYGVKVKTPYNDAILRGIVDRKGVKTTIDYTDIVTDKQTYPIRYIQPYLRPMLSISEEEYDDMFHQLYLGQEEFFRNCSNADTIGKIIGKDMVIYDFLTKKMFDFRCLIPKGLALVAPEGMYN